MSKLFNVRKLRKAFDTVIHNFVLAKMAAINF